jgi:hypothetical protein
MFALATSNKGDRATMCDVIGVGVNPLMPLRRDAEQDGPGKSGYHERSSAVPRIHYLGIVECVSEPRNRHLSALTILTLGSIVAAWRRMKIPRSLHSGTVFGFALLVSACAMFHPRTGRDTLVGTWSNPLDAIWTIKSDGTFDVDLNHNGQRDVWGKYTVSGDTITLLRKGGFITNQCAGRGVYRFNRTGNTLQFTLISDDCRLRRKYVLLPWRLK